MIAPLAVLAFISGALLWIVGARHLALRLCLFAVALGAVGAFFEQTFEELLAFVEAHTGALIALAVVVLASAGFVSHRHHEHRLERLFDKHPTSLKRRVERDR